MYMYTHSPNLKRKIYIMNCYLVVSMDDDVHVLSNQCMRVYACVCVCVRAVLLIQRQNGRSRNSVSFTFFVSFVLFLFLFFYFFFNFRYSLFIAFLFIYYSLEFPLSLHGVSQLVQICIFKVFNNLHLFTE